MKKSRIKFEVTDIAVLAQAHPDCVMIQNKTIINRSKLYEKIKAAKILNIQIPGVSLVETQE